MEATTPRKNTDGSNADDATGTGGGSRNVGLDDLIELFRRV